MATEKLTFSAWSTSKRTGALPLSRRKGVGFLLTIPFLWILYESIWQQDAALQRRIDQPHFRANQEKFNSVIGMEQLTDIAPVHSVYANHSLDGATWDEAMVGREAVVDVLTRAGLSISLDVLKLLPTWDTVQKLYGEKPVILGLERCQEFRSAHKPAERFTGIAGLHNCGTNAMARYLKQNVRIPGNSREGFMAHVPWHKHGWESLRHTYNFSFPDDHDSVLPIVIVRDPYFWMHSMCESPYLLRWEHTAFNCPHLIQSDGSGNPAETQWGDFPRAWDSLAHVWSEFYGEYEQVEYPRLMIRFEDVLFHTEQVIDQIRECAGGQWKNEHFIHAPSAVKSNKYFTDIKPQSSLLSAIIKYGQDRGMRLKQMTKEEEIYAHDHLDAHLMEAFHYVHPRRLD